MKVLVTGGAGYIGSHTVQRLVEEEHEVVVFDNLSTGHIEAVHPDAEFVFADLLDKEAVQQTMQEHRPEAILHFAAHTLVGESMSFPWMYLGENITAAANLLEMAVRYKVSKFVLSSTSNLFGISSGKPIPPSAPISPASPYGESKAIVERYLHWMDALYGMKYAALRYFNAAGAHPDGTLGEDHTPETHLIPLVIQAAMKGETLFVFGDDYPTPDGTCVRDYVHVLDLADAHVKALDVLNNDERGSFAVNLGVGRGYSVMEIIKSVEAVSGLTVPFKVVGRRGGDPASLTADPSDAFRLLGWTPEFANLDAIIATAWKWHSTKGHY